MKRINLSSLLAGISLITLSLVTLSVPTYASTPKDADASDLTAPLASRSASPATSDDEGDEVEEADPRIVKLETQLKEQDTYFAGKLKTMTATTYALRKEVRTLTDALEEQKRLAAQQQAALTKAASVSPADNGAASAAPAAALSNAAEQDKILDLQTQLAAQKALVATAVSENDTLTATLTTRQFEFDTLSQQHALLKGLYGPCATQNTELAIQLKAVTGERDAHAVKIGELKVIGLRFAQHLVSTNKGKKDSLLAKDQTLAQQILDSQKLQKVGGSAGGSPVKPKDTGCRNQ